MAAELAKHVGFEGDITYSTNNGLVAGRFGCGDG
ncbi:phosphatase yitU [Mycobacterium tuberculosis]|nr:phosphatase yitU [Mycobacterium tuberculosis]